MTQEEKDLLLKDLCGRLPHGVKFLRESWNYEWDQELSIVEVLEDIDKDGYINNSKVYKVEDIKPYLRPMSSMTEEEKEELKSKCIYTETEEDWEGVRCDVWGIQILEKYDTRRWDNPIWPSTINMDAIDWLNKNHFDYRGLIPMGLAIDCTNLNIY